MSGGVMIDIRKLWEELNKQEQEEFGAKNNYEELQHYVNNETATLMEMANIRGNDIKRHSGIPFSLFMSTKEQVHGVHAIRVKVLWNPNKMTSTPDGQMELHSDYQYTSFAHKYKPSTKEIKELREFCKQYKVFFAAIWGGVLDPNDFIQYLQNNKSFQDLLATFDLKGRDYYNVNHCKTLSELEDCIRKNKIFNMNKPIIYKTFFKN